FRGPIGIGYAAQPVEGYEYSTQVILDEPPHRITRTTLHSPFGDLTSTEETGMIPHDPLVGKTTEYFVKRAEDWRVFIDLWERELETARPTGNDTVEEAVQLMAEDGVPSVGLGSAFTMVASQRGMQDFMYDLYDCPHLLKRAHDLACDLYENTIKSFLMTSAEVGFYDICWATGMSLGPELFDQWLGEEVARMCGLVRSTPGKFITLYTLGKMREIMPTLMNARPHMIATFEPNEGDLTLREAKRLYGSQTCIMGNFDCVILAHGSLDDARAETMRCLQEGMEGGAYILGTGDEVPAGTRFDNLKAMVEVTEEFGRY
ncbi:MAG: uroporphyrinogen decarboxylase family protein, partial [Armatimonadota bacterium]